MQLLNIKKSKGEFFKILAETPLSQVGVMTIKPGGDSGPEDIHSGDQIIYIIEGEAEVETDGEKHNLTEGMAGIIPAKAKHHIYNNGTKELFFLTIYTPPAY
jgi:quercetin dioxygenase-like cupin family protein